MPLLAINEVSVHVSGDHSVGQQSVLIDKVSCDLEIGEVLSIIGPNGAGKSTLLKAIAGDLPYRGEIAIKGVSDVAKLRARQVAVLPQLSLLNFPYRVSEVVGLARIPHATGRQRDQQIVHQALQMMDIDFLQDRLYTELSGGEKQRVQLARVLAQVWDANDAENGTRLLLLDEPTAALDLGHQQQLMSVISDFAKQGVAVIMVLHDINLAAHNTDKMLALLCSQRVAFGAPKDVMTVENINTLFGIEAKLIKHPQHGTPILIGL